MAKKKCSPYEQSIKGEEETEHEEEEEEEEENEVC